jgi:hypothetical protein
LSKLSFTVCLTVLDSGFRVPKDLNVLRMRGFTAAAVVRKLPKHIDGDGMKAHIKGRQVSITDVIVGNLGGVQFQDFVCHEDDHNIKYVITYRSKHRTTKWK